MPIQPHDLGFLTDEDVKSLFGITQATLSAWRKSRRIPYSLVGNRYLYDREAITALVRAGVRLPVGRVDSL